MNEDVMSNHYAHPRGRPRLLKAISKHYSPQFENLVKEGRELRMDEIVATAGANCGQSICVSREIRLITGGSGMFAAMTAHLEPGDEVILIEPYFDQYFAPIHFLGAKPVFVPLHPPAGPGIKQGSEWKMDFDEFRAAFTPRTKIVIVNTPHNPSGKVFTRDELEKIATICVEEDVLVLADEVYDCLVYDGREHVRIATLPGMWERTLTVGSGGSEYFFGTRDPTDLSRILCMYWMACR